MQRGGVLYGGKGEKVLKLGIIGTGNMARALVKGMLKNGMLRPDDLIASNPGESSRKEFSELFSVEVTRFNIEAVRKSDAVLLAVKPQFYEAVIREIGREADGKLIISLAPGKTIEWLEEKFGERRVRIIRAMSNTPSMIGEGMTAYCVSDAVTKADIEFVGQILSACGKSSHVPEHLMEAVVAVAGSAPAYVFIMLEAMADAAVALGMPRGQAYEMAAQTVAGSARMLLETGRHPGELKDMVCSPGGTTIEAVRMLEAGGFRSALIEAMKACADKAKKM